MRWPLRKYKWWNWTAVAVITIWFTAFPHPPCLMTYDLFNVSESLLTLFHHLWVWTLVGSKCVQWEENGLHYSIWHIRYFVNNSTPWPDPDPVLP